MLPSILFLFVQLAFAGFMLYLLIAFVTGGPFVPSQMSRAKRMIALAKLSSKSVVYDLGSGDGRLLMLAAQKGAHVVGVEINPYLVWYSRLRAFLSPRRNRIRVLWKNLWKTDIHEANVVFVYLLPFRMNELAAKLKQELNPGSLVIINSFIFPGWKILRQDATHHVYVYEV